MGQFLWILIQIFILPFKIVFAILEFIGTSLIMPIIYSGLKHGPKELFVWFCIISTVYFILGYLAN